MSQSTEKQLRDEIHRVLQNVTSDNAPTINRSIQTEMGYKNIEAKIITLCVNEQMTPSASVPHIEREL